LLHGDLKIYERQIKGLKGGVLKRFTAENMRSGS